MHRQSRRTLAAVSLLLGVTLPCALSGIALTTAMGATRPESQPSPKVMNGRIAFATEGARSQIYSVNPDGSDERQLTHVAAGVQVDMPDWSPNGGQIAYVSNASGSFDLMVMNADGSDQSVLAHSDGWDYQEPRWSPDGRRFAVMRCNQQFGFCDIDVLNADGTGRHIVVGGHLENFDPAWSPDGQELAFASNRAGLVSANWVLNLASSTLRRLTKPALDACFPSWSPRGTWILFMSDCDRSNPHVFVMRSDGSRAHRLSHEPPNKSSAVASYSPDGRRIVFISDILVGFGADLFTMNSNGTGQTAIVTDHRHIFFSDWGTNTTTDIGMR